MRKMSGAISVITGIRLLRVWHYADALLVSMQFARSLEEDDGLIDRLTGRERPSLAPTARADCLCRHGITSARGDEGTAPQDPPQGRENREERQMLVRYPKHEFSSS